MQAGITGCEFLVARTGSVVISSALPSGRQMNVFPPIHIVLAHVSQLVDYPEDAFVAIQNKYGEDLPSIISTITGPSRTADIEKTLVLGAHGPKEFIVFLSKV
jgi:L-lactate dehydrogenase complex protein LldG